MGKKHTMTPIDLKQIKIRDFKQEISETLQYGDQIYFQGMASVNKIQGEANEDGTQNVLYLAACQLCEVKKAPDEVTPPVSIVEDKKLRQKSESQALRQLAYRVGQETGVSEDGLYKAAIQIARDWLEARLDDPE